MTPPFWIDADVVVVGSGFAGSLVALALKQRGYHVVLVERGRHPRFAIGEGYAVYRGPTTTGTVHRHAADDAKPGGC